MLFTDKTKMMIDNYLRQGGYVILVFVCLFVC